MQLYESTSSKQSPGGKMVISMGNVVILSYKGIKTKGPKQLQDDADGQLTMTPSDVELTSK